MQWHEMYEFSDDCVLMVLANDIYKESDYIRNYYEFKKRVNNENREVILETINDALEQTGVEKRYDAIGDDIVLLETELDSLGFAILVALLEDKLGYDPFQLMEEAVYPRTFGEFVSVYERFAQ